MIVTFKVKGEDFYARKSRVRNMQHALTRADRSLTGHKRLVVNLQTGSIDAAWTTTGVISINLMDQDVTKENLPFILGLNYHEIGHVLFTPTNPTADTPASEFNLLEDQRMESLMVAAFPSMAGYYRVAFARMLKIGRKEAYNHQRAGLHDDLTYVFAYGRRYLAKDVRRKLRMRMVRRVGRPDVLELERIVDAYRALDLPRMMGGSDLLKVQKLSRELRDLIVKWMVGQPGMTMSDSSQHQGKNSTKSVSQGFPMDQTLAREARAALNEDDAADSEDGDIDAGQTADKAAETAVDESSSPAGDDDPTDEESSSSVDARHPNGASQESGESDTSGDGSETTPAQDGMGSDEAGGKVGGGSSPAPKQDLEDDGSYIDVPDLIEAILNETLSAEVNDEVAGWLDVLASPDVRAVAGDPESWRKPTSAEVEASQKFASKISGVVRDDIDPGWERGHPSGRVNMQRAMHDDDYDTLFDRWYEGHNSAFDLEAMVAVDISSSMDVKAQVVCRGAWIIRRGIEQLGGHCAACAWNSEFYWLYDEQKLNTQSGINIYGCGGTTNPIPFLNEAVKRFEAPHRTNANKVLFILTDGQWENDMVAASYLERLQHRGVIIVLVGLGYGIPSSMYPHDVLTKIENAEELPDVAEKIVEALYRRISAGLTGRE